MFPMSDICSASHSGVPVTANQFLRSDSGNMLLWKPERRGGVGSTYVSYSEGPNISYPD
jgi:hypothetical protein